jgi:hypothetical protein
VLLDHKLVTYATTGIVESLDALFPCKPTRSCLTLGRSDVGCGSDVIDKDHTAIGVWEFPDVELAFQHVDYFRGDRVYGHNSPEFDHSQISGANCASGGM